MIRDHFHKNLRTNAEKAQLSTEADKVKQIQALGDILFSKDLSLETSEAKKWLQ